MRHFRGYFSGSFSFRRGERDRERETERETERQRREMMPSTSLGLFDDKIDSLMQRNREDGWRRSHARQPLRREKHLIVHRRAHALSRVGSTTVVSTHSLSLFI